jgi:hypothetical protein
MKLAAVILAAVLVLLSLAACGDAQTVSSAALSAPAWAAGVFGPERGYRLVEVGDRLVRYDFVGDAFASAKGIADRFPPADQHNLAGRPLVTLMTTDGQVTIVWTPVESADTWQVEATLSNSGVN